MDKKAVILITVILAACVTPTTQFDSTNNATSSQLAETQSQLYLPTPQPASEDPHFSLGMQSAPPPLYFIHGNTVLEQLDGEITEKISTLPDAGQTKSAILAIDRLLVLREQGLQRVKLEDGSSKMVYSSDAAVLFGELILASGGTQVLYSAVIDDPRAEFGLSTLIGIYNRDNDVARTIITLPQNARVLGLTPDGRGLYILPLGQDPEFGSVFLVKLDESEVVKELVVEGSLYASLSQDGRQFATTTSRCIECEQPENVLILYDLPSLPLTPPLTFALPLAPSHIAGLSWSMDGKRLYFLLNSGMPWDERLNSYGLWYLELPSGEIFRLAAVGDAAMHIHTTSPNGQWMLLENENRPESILINLSSGETRAFTVPTSALTIMWR